MKTRNRDRRSSDDFGATMTRSVATIMMLGLMSCSHHGARTIAKPVDGYWWIRSSSQDKVATVAVMADAIESGYDAARARAIPYISHNMNALDDVVGHWPKYGKDPSAYVTSVDAIEVRQEAQKLPISSVIICLADGVDADRCIDKDLSILRNSTE